MNKRSPFQTMVLSSMIVSQIVGSIVVGVFGGKWVDEQIGTFPVFMIGGIFLGLFAGIYSVMYSLKKYL